MAEYLSFTYRHAMWGGLKLNSNNTNHNFSIKNSTVHWKVFFNVSTERKNNRAKTGAHWVWPQASTGFGQTRGFLHTHEITKYGLWILRQGNLRTRADVVNITWISSYNTESPHRSLNVLHFGKNRGGGHTFLHVKISYFRDLYRSARQDTEDQILESQNKNF